MKIQNLAVIFIIIILPISLILSAYTQNLVQTLELQSSYDSKLNNATYDALKAFQLNTINSTTSDLANSKLRDIEASVNTFFNSISSNFNMAGYNQDILKEYVPALVYTMYDGFYIYSPFINTLPEGDFVEDFEGSRSTYVDGEKISNLKPYIHYSCRYVKGNVDVVITYSLDNYIVVDGKINGEGVHESGYLIDEIVITERDGNGNATKLNYRNVGIEGETMLQEYIGPNNDPSNLYSYVKVNGVKYYKDTTDNTWFTILNGQRSNAQPEFSNITLDYSAVQYYAKAAEFTNWVNTNLGNLEVDNMVDIEEGDKERFNTIRNIFRDSEKSIEEPDSNFNQHRLAVIRYVVEKNLSTAIANYNNFVGQAKANFVMPVLKEDEWEKILNNISIISFLQGLNIGGKIYNGYSIITNTKNEEVVTEDSIYIVSDDGTNAIYHNVREEELNDDPNIKLGILNIDLERKSRTENGNSVFFYPKTYLADYTSVVTQTNVADNYNIYKYLDDNNILAKLYYTALGRERNGTYKTAVTATDTINRVQL